MEVKNENTTPKTISNDVDKEQKGINVPNLRLNEFNTNWTSLVLSDICSFRKIHRTSTKRDYVSTENILQNYQGIERFSSGAVVSGDGFNCGDILMGNIRPYLKKVYMADFDGVCNSDVLVFKSEKVMPAFLHCILANDKFINYVMNSAKGSKMPRGDKQHIMNYPISIPNNAEQSKIANLIDLLNLRILAQSKIIEDLETQMKAINHKAMSELQGVTINLSEVAEIYQPTTITQSNFVKDGKYLVYGANGIIGLYDKYNHENEQVCVTCRGATCGSVNITKPKSWITGNSMVINTDNSTRINKYYLYYYLKNFDFSSVISGSGQPQIVRSSMDKIKICLPSLIEQEYIVNFLNIFDEKIQKEKDMLELYKKQKAYLLQNMFI